MKNRVETGTVDSRIPFRSAGRFLCSQNLCMLVVLAIGSVVAGCPAEECNSDAWQCSVTNLNTAVEAACMCPGTENNQICATGTYPQFYIDCLEQVSDDFPEERRECQAMTALRLRDCIDLAECDRDASRACFRQGNVCRDENSTEVRDRRRLCENLLEP